MKLKKLIEGFFSPETPTEKTSYKVTRKAEQRGPLTYPYPEIDETLTDKEIDQELQLELKLSPTMKDPLNLSGRNFGNAGHGYGKLSKTFANFAPNETEATLSKQETRVIPISVANDPDDLEELELVEESNEVVALDPQHDPETNEMYRKAFAKKLAHREEANAKKAKPKKGSPWDKISIPRDPLQEDVGTRDKGLAYGSPVQTTKQPFASGVPTDHMKRNDEGFFDEDEIAEELGLVEEEDLKLKEWISSRFLAQTPSKSELDFFDEDSFENSRSEEEFKRTQQKKKHK